MNIDIFHHFIIYPIFGFFNNLMMGQLKCIILFLFFSYLVNNWTPMENFFEFIVDFIIKTVDSVLQEKSKYYYEFFIILFFVIFFSNLYGLIPHQFSFNSHIIVTACWALIVFFYGIFQGLKNPIKFFNNFIPHGAPWPFIFLITPLKVISFLLTPVSLSLRLFINVLVGHVMLTIFETFGHEGNFLAQIPSWFFLIGLTVMETGISLLQTYIFLIASINIVKNCIK
jgi:F-type H+-transporting ATPase subunit a